MNPTQPGNDVAMFCHQLQLGFLARLPHLNGVQISIYILLDRICGPNHEWITIGTRHICEALHLNRGNALIAIRGLIAAGLVESPEPGLKRRRWYRTRPNLPINQDDWAFRLFGEATRKSGTENPPDEAYQNWSGKHTRLSKSGTETIPDQNLQSGLKTVPVVIQMNDFFEPLNKESIISLQERVVSSSSEVVPESLKADEEEHAAQNGLIPHPSGFPEFRAIYPAARLDETKSREAFEALPLTDRDACVRGLVVHVACERWQRTPEFIPLASNFIKRNEWKHDPPPFFAPKNGSSAAAEHARVEAESKAARARALFKTIQESQK